MVVTTTYLPLFEIICAFETCLLHDRAASGPPDI